MLGRYEWTSMRSQCKRQSSYLGNSGENEQDAQKSVLRNWRRQMAKATQGKGAKWKKRETNNKNGSFIVNGKPEGKSKTHESGCVYANSMVSQASSTEYRKVNHPVSAVTWTHYKEISTGGNEITTGIPHRMASKLKYSFITINHVQSVRINEWLKFNRRIRKVTTSGQ